MLLTATEKLNKYVSELNARGHRFEFRKSDKRAFGYITKRDIEIELLVSGRDVYFGVLLPKAFANVHGLERALGKAGFVIATKFERTQHLRYLPAGKEFLEEVEYFINTLQSLDMLEDMVFSWKSTAEVKTRIKNIAKIIKLAHKTKDTTLLVRELVDPITPSVAINAKTTKCNYGEHVVPIDFLFSNSCAMLDDGKTEKDIIDYWERNLAVAYITESDARKMDVDLKLRTTMPEGWKDGDDPFERLKIAKIKVDGLNQDAILIE